MDWWRDGGSELLGPPIEWFRYDDGAAYQYFHNVFWATVVGILESEPGGYDELPWVWTEDAVEALAQYDA